MISNSRGRSLVFSAFVAAFTCAAGSPLAATVTGDTRVLLKNVTYDAKTGPPPAAAHDDAFDAGAVESWIVVLAAPADEAARRRIEDAGARIVGAIPENAYLVRATGEMVQVLRADRGVLRADRYEPAWKIAGETAAVGAERTLLTIEVFPGESTASVAELARAAGFDVVRTWDTARVRRVVVRAPSGAARSRAIESIARVSAVEWIEPAHVASVRNDTVRWVIQSNVVDEVPLFDHGLLGAGQIAGLIDTAVYFPSCWFADPLVSEPGPTHRKIVAYHSTIGFGAHGHGTHVAGILAGDREPTVGTLINRGMAPKARFSFTDLNDVEGSGMLISNLDSLLTQSHGDGARVHSNSWGDDNVGTMYTSWCRDIDAFSHENEEDLVVFAETNTGTVKTPENAKNCVAVGAADRPPNQENIASGGAGPTGDGRRKPELFAPGIGTTSAGLGSCESATSGGTSMAAPAVAGAAVLIRDYFMRGYFPTGAPNPSRALTPSGSLLKAMLITSGDDMDMYSGYPTYGEGWGRILLDDVLPFAEDPERLWIQDVRHAHGLSTGGVHVEHLRVVDSEQRLRVTLVFADVPAALAAASAPVNDLNLEVEGPGGLFLGNVFNVPSGVSVTGGAADSLNNVECIVLDAPAAGDWTVRVRGRAVPEGPQGYAVVATGGLFHAARFEIANPPDPGEIRGSSPSLSATPSLSGPRPNPFRSETKFRLALPAPASVRVAIYDVTGRQVRRLLERRVAAGDRDLAWDGKDDQGREVPAGIYFARLTGPGFDRQVKGVLLR